MERDRQPVPLRTNDLGQCLVLPTHVHVVFGRAWWRTCRDDEMAVRASLARPETVVAGVVAPLLAGATVLLPDDETVGSVAVADSDAPEERVVAVGAVDL